MECWILAPSFWRNLMPFHFDSDQTCRKSMLLKMSKQHAKHHHIMAFTTFQIWCGPPLFLARELVCRHGPMNRWLKWKFTQYAYILLVLGMSSQSYGIYHLPITIHKNINIPIVLNHGAQNCAFSFIVQHVIILIVSNSNHFHLNYLFSFFWVS
jgi:hypothetical protein